MSYTLSPTGKAARLLREEVFARDNFRCVYCGEAFAADALTIDHVEPRMRGGDHSGGNLVTACGACNTRKAGRRLTNFLRDEPAAREQFFALAAEYVWSRIMRAVEDELRRPARPR